MRPRWAITGPARRSCCGIWGIRLLRGPLVPCRSGSRGRLGSRLTALQRFQFLFVVLSIAFFVVAFRRLYVRSEEFAMGEACAVPSARHRQHVIFWVVMPAAVALMSFPLYAPLFY